MEKKQYQLMCTYLKGKYFISTIYRESSAMIQDCWYFETMVWEWNDKTRERGSIIEMDDSGISEEQAMDNHLLMVKKMNYLIMNEGFQNSI
jgi:hypothetical protein